MNSTPLIFAHIGDLHITKAKEQNYIDFLSIVSQIETCCSNQLDFVYLPGDNADNGLPDQYKLVATALKMLSVPVHIITGDHDMEQGGLAPFYSLPLAEKLPHSVIVKGIKCIFLDVCGPGSGGPDFRLGAEQLNWLENELRIAKDDGLRIVIFTHTYPADLADEQEAAKLTSLIAETGVLLVDMGHTHYNELANDGRTIFAATRSTGQIEEGPVGYSLTAIDNGVVSWRFKPLDDAFPFVMITSPADRRLLRCEDDKVTGNIIVRALIFSMREVANVKCSINEGGWIAMTKNDQDFLWSATVSVPSDKEQVTITVEATDDTGRPGRHAIKASTVLSQPIILKQSGSDSASIGSWPDNGIFGTQLGPNRNGKPS